MLCHIFQYVRAECTVSVPFVNWKPLSYEHTPRPTHTCTSSLAIKRALPVLALRLVSVFSADCSGSGLPFLVLLMWRDDTCWCWIELHKGFQIKNPEWHSGWAGVLFLLTEGYLLLNSKAVSVIFSRQRPDYRSHVCEKGVNFCLCEGNNAELNQLFSSFKWNEWIETVGWPVIHGRVNRGNWIISQWWNFLEVISLRCFIGQQVFTVNLLCSQVVNKAQVWFLQHESKKMSQLHVLQLHFRIVQLSISVN